jgi:hypothetical protein
MSDTAVLTVTTRGHVAAVDEEYAAGKVREALGVSSDPAPVARLVLTAHEDPAREEPASAKVDVDLHRRSLRAHATAPTMHEAADALDARLRRRLGRVEARPPGAVRRLRDAAGAEWRHGQARTPRGPVFPRPAEEREIVTRKLYPLGPVTVEEAAFELDELDHDFYLFANVESGEDALLVRTVEGLELLEPVETTQLDDRAVDVRRSTVAVVPLTVDAAREILDLGDEPFAFFLEGGRGRVLYRRYDGHYGLIVPAEEPAAVIA